MIQYCHGDLFKSDVVCLVNPVNCVGIMGAGLAKQFKEKFPKYFETYKQACRDGLVEVGTVDVYRYMALDVTTRYILSFPTKNHYKDPSNIAYIAEGLKSLVDVVKDKKIPSIAIPALGCGLGGLRWSEVKPLIEIACSQLPEVQCLLFEPN